MKRTFCWVVIIGRVISFGIIGFARKDKEIKIGALCPLRGNVAIYGEIKR